MEMKGCAIQRSFVTFCNLFPGSAPDFKRNIMLTSLKRCCGTVAVLLLVAMIVVEGMMSSTMAQTTEPATRPVAAAEPFPLGQVRLLDGPFKQMLDVNTQYLLSIDPDRLLAGFRTEAGLKEKAQRYGGWEAKAIHGHSLGHYLSAISATYA